MAGTLFIGGVADGQRIEIKSDSNYVSVPNIPTETLLIDGPPVTNFAVDHYESETFIAAGQVFRVFVLRGQGGDFAMRKLIENYQLKGNSQCCV